MMERMMETATPLMPSLEEMSDSDKDVLVERIGTDEYWNENDRLFEAGQQLRARVKEGTASAPLHPR